MPPARAGAAAPRPRRCSASHPRGRATCPATPSRRRAQLPPGEPAEMPSRGGGRRSARPFPPRRQPFNGRAAPSASASPLGRGAAVPRGASASLSPPPPKPHTHSPPGAGKPPLAPTCLPTAARTSRPEARSTGLPAPSCPLAPHLTSPGLTHCPARPRLPRRLLLWDRGSAGLPPHPRAENSAYPEGGGAAACRARPSMPAAVWAQVGSRGQGGRSRWDPPAQRLGSPPHLLGAGWERRPRSAAPSAALPPSPGIARCLQRGHGAPSRGGGRGHAQRFAGLPAPGRPLAEPHLGRRGKNNQKNKNPNTKAKKKNNPNFAARNLKRGTFPAPAPAEKQRRPVPVPAPPSLAARPPPHTRLSRQPRPDARPVRGPGSAPAAGCQRPAGAGPLPFAGIFLSPSKASRRPPGAQPFPIPATRARGEIPTGGDSPAGEGGGEDPAVGPGALMQTVLLSHGS